MSYDPEYITIDGVIEHETDRAALVGVGEDKPIWIPKSLIESMDTDKEGLSSIEVAEWFAIKEGLV
jgi:hypothetical protein